MIYILFLWSERLGHIKIKKMIIIFNPGPPAEFSENLAPFYSPEDTEKARCICADVMTAEEREEFPYHVQ